MKKIVITGAPCTGKTEYIEYVRRRSLRNVCFVPEVAHILFSTNLQNASGMSIDAVHHVIFTLQKSIEKCVFACGTEMAFHLLDRGSLDVVAYCSNTFTQDYSIDVQKEYRNYDIILLFQMPSCEEQYDDYMNQSNNPYRYETYVEALQVETRLNLIWAEHPQFFRVPSFREVEHKFKYVNRLIGIDT